MWLYKLFDILVKGVSGFVYEGKSLGRGGRMMYIVHYFYKGMIHGNGKDIKYKWYDTCSKVQG